MSQLLRARRVLTEQGWLERPPARMAHGVITAIEPIPAGVARAMPNCFARRISIRTSGGRAWMSWMMHQTCWIPWPA
jgi:N-acetylgalactosamine-6-phosphate deacetylase